MLKHVYILSEYFIKEWYKNDSICPFENKSENSRRVWIL